MNEASTHLVIDLELSPVHPPRVGLLVLLPRANVVQELLHQRSLSAPRWAHNQDVILVLPSHQIIAGAAAGRGAAAVAIVAAAEGGQAAHATAAHPAAAAAAGLDEDAVRVEAAVVVEAALGRTEAPATAARQEGLSRAAAA